MGTTSVNPAVTPEIRATVDILARAARPLRVILFGSRARGAAGPDADADLLIVQAEADAVHRSRWRELQRIRAALREVPLAKDLLLYRPQEFDHWRNSLNHVVGRAVREGIVLYERP
jgi:predicted nucleotidyltransferase